jgi:hypothetical protein
VKGEPLHEVRVRRKGVSYDMNQYASGWYFRLRPSTHQSSWHGPYSSRSLCEQAALSLIRHGFVGLCDPRYR